MRTGLTLRHLSILLLLLAALAPRLAAAHSASSSYLNVAVHGRALAVQWSIALRDLDYAIGIDSNDDGTITWGEVREHSAAINAYALAHLQLSADGKFCALGSVIDLADRLGDGAYAVLRFAAQCAGPPRQVGVRYSLLFNQDPLHRGLLTLVVGGVCARAAGQRR